jgi:hypothetical protein
MFAYVIIHRPSGRDTSIFTLYVATAGSADEAIESVTRKFALSGSCEVNGKPLDTVTVAALGLQPGDVHAL